jgi:hypothetical protein
MSRCSSARSQRIEADDVLDEAPVAVAQPL